MSSTPSPHALAAREEKRQAAAAIGIDDRFVSDLVDTFYGRVREDDLIGPIFAERISDWGPHLDQMKRFWRAVLFSSGEFFGNPMLKHLAIPEMGRPHFVRWLQLFDETLRDIGSEAARELVHGKARMIATSLLNGIVVHRDKGLGLSKSEMF